MSSPISSPRNERIRAARALGTRQGRRKAGRFLLEGPKVIDEALARRPELVESVLRRAGPLDERTERTLAACAARGVPCLDVAPSIFDGLARSDAPQPVLAVAIQAWSEAATLLAPGGGPRAVVACLGVQDPGNVGTILRTARFFGLGGVVLVGGQDPWAPKVVRAAAGALLDLPPARAASVADVLVLARAGGFEVLALDAHGGADPRRAPLPTRALLLLGAEGPGLQGVDLSRVQRLTITPGGDGQGESLNVAVAFAIVAAAWAAR